VFGNKLFTDCSRSQPPIRSLPLSGRCSGDVPKPRNGDVGHELSKFRLKRRGPKFLPQSFADVREAQFSEVSIEHKCPRDAVPTHRLEAYAVDQAEVATMCRE
jgi:hypothetical protein